MTSVANFSIRSNQTLRLSLSNPIIRWFRPVAAHAAASAANYINKIGWNYKSSCFHKVELTKPISEKYINVSAKKIKNYLTIKSWKKRGIIDIHQINCLLYTSDAADE